MRKLPSFAALALLAGGCASDNTAPASKAGQGNLNIEFAPWEVDSEADFACYSITVNGPDGAEVWAEDAVCTDAFGHADNGNLVYVGICDATGDNSVRISLTELRAMDGEDLSNWGDNPPTFIDESVECIENGDVRVQASFLVLTAAEKGFLDIKVEVNEIACSAKIDCINDFLEAPEEEGTPDQDEGDQDEGQKEHRSGDQTDRDGDQDEDQDGKTEEPADQDEGDKDEEPAQDEGDKDEEPVDQDDGDQDDAQQDADVDVSEPGNEGTIIVGFACDAPNLYMDEILLHCTDESGADVTVSVDPSAGPGWHDGYPNEFVFAALSTQGVTSDGETSFWNVAIGVRSGWADCSISARMAATPDGDFGANETFPVIIADAVAFDFDDNGDLVCSHPLDGEGSGLISSWADADDLDFDFCLEADASSQDMTDVSVGACEE